VFSAAQGEFAPIFFDNVRLLADPLVRHFERNNLQ